MKRLKYLDLEDIVYRIELTSEENVDILNVKKIVGSTKRYNLKLRFYEITDINLLPKEKKVNFTIDNIRLKSNISINKTITFVKKSFFSIQY